MPETHHHFNGRDWTACGRRIEGLSSTPILDQVTCLACLRRRREGAELASAYHPDNVNKARRARRWRVLEARERIRRGLGPRPRK